MVAPRASYVPYLLMLLLFLVMLALTVFFLRRPEPIPLTISTPVPSATPTTALLVVDVRGAVARPGVYTLTVGSRVLDALAQAGEPLPDGDIRRLNPARKLNDGEQIYVPTIGEVTLTPATTPAKSERLPASTKTPFGTINLNTAAVDELDLLPGIGPAIGQRIVDYRAQNGPFATVEDLKKVRGIGDAIFAGLQDLVTVQ